MNISLIFPLIVYVCIIIFISFYSYLKQKNTLKDYFLASRSLNGFVLSMSLSATYISASSFIGGPGGAYKYGFAWVAVSLIQVPIALFSFGVLGKKIAALSIRYDALSLNDILLKRYQNKYLIIFASLSLILSFLGAISVGLIGGARLLEVSLNLDYKIGLILFTSITIFYTMIGGFRASSLNDTMQGIVMFFGSIMLFVCTLREINGIDDGIMELKNINKSLISQKGVDDILSFPFAISMWILVCFGTIALPHTTVRFLSFKDSKSLNAGIIYSTIVIFVIMFCMHVSGVLAKLILDDKNLIPDLVIPTLIIKIFPPFLAGIFLAAPISAIASTVNSQLLQISQTIINDLYLQFCKSSYENRLIFLAKFVIAFIGFILIFISLNPPDMIIWLNFLSFGAMQVVFLWPLVLGIFWDKANDYGAFASMFTGLLCYIVLTIFSIKIYNLHQIVPSLLFSLISFFIFNKLKYKIFM